MQSDVLNEAAGIFFDKKEAAQALALIENCKLGRMNKLEQVKYYTLVGLASFNLGKIFEAVNGFKKASEAADVDDVKRRLYSNYLMYLHYLPDVSDDFLREEHFRCNKLFDDIVLFSHHKKSKKVLRVGYLAPIFSTHIVMNFTIQLLAQYDRSCFEVICYDLAEKENRTTQQVKQLVNGWRNLYGISPKQAAQQIYDDDIDILIDLGGHTDGGTTLHIMAYKPAPIQLSMIGYFDTTGLQAMDYFLGDVFCDTDKTTDLFIEKVLRLPHSHLCYTPSEAAVKTEIRYQGHEQVVFGSFNNFAKITDEMLSIWKKILDIVPQSKLILKNVSEDMEIVDEMKQRMKKVGFNNEQIELRTGSLDYIGEYADIDIALDTYPYPGGGTTCEALYMGVPVVTRYGTRHGSRFGYSLLMNCGIGELTAQTEEEYIEKAVALANDKELLMVLHQNLRSMMMRSPLMDGRGYTRDVEKLYKMIWEKWLKND